MKLTNEEISRVLHMYWGCNIAIENGIGGNTTIEPMRKVNIPHDSDYAISINGIVHPLPKLSLSPLSSITDEHAIGIASMMPDGFTKDAASGRNWISFMGFTNLNYTNYQYLVQQGYAVPLFFGLNHWANGKTAIELGVAIEKPVDVFGSESAGVVNWDIQKKPI